MYQHFLKRLADIVLSFAGMLVLALPMLVLAICIKVDSRGPVFFRQRRIGIHKREFTLIKFRSMPTTAPRDVATHQLDVASVKLSKFQKLLRASSLDELPQLFNIFLGHMSIIGPRPGLPSQTDLIAERDKYGANDIKPGLTGLAQIRGRDELAIPVKAALDGEYTAALRSGHFKGFLMDVRCFFGTITAVLCHDGVVEGGTGEMEKKQALPSAEPEQDLTDSDTVAKEKDVAAP